MSGLPVVSPLAGFNDEHRPARLKFIVAAAKDQNVLEFAMAYEQLT